MPSHSRTRHLGTMLMGVATLVGLPLAGGFIGGFVTASATTGSLGGHVFRDYNANGVADVNEPGISGVSVVAYDTAGTSYGPATTDSNGDWTIGSLTGTYRVEFAWSQTYLRESAQSASIGGSGSSVQFAAAPRADVNLGLENPSDYCQSNPDIVATCFTQGMPDTTARTSIHRQTYGATVKPAVAQVADTKSVYGLAYQRSTKKLFSSAYAKRHAAQYESPTPLLGQIFASDTTVSANATPFVDVSALGIDVGNSSVPFNTGVGGRELSTTGTPENDVDGLAKAGKFGLLDLAISEDESALWATNGFINTGIGETAGKLVKVNLSAGGASALSASQFPVPVTCTGGSARPFGIAVKDAKVYVGVVCDAEFSASTTDLTAQVVVFDIASSTWAGAPVLGPFALQYTRGCVVVGQSQTCDVWHPWTGATFDPSVTFPGNAAESAYPQPMLSDLVFADDGSLIMGLRDRYGDTVGRNQYQPVALSTSPETGHAGGDVLKACLVGGSYVLEGSVGCGRTGNEFFAGESSTNHDETAMGSLAVLRGSGTVVGSSSDPTGNSFSGGVRYWPQTGGTTIQNSLRIYPDAVNSFGKANGIGALELLCDQAPVEIGNKVWEDTDGDGRQDPGEPALPGVNVKLFDTDGTTVLAIASTDAEGNYLFSSATAGTGGSGAVYGISALTPKAGSYKVSIDTTQSVLTSYTPTPADAAVQSPDASQDNNDSDGTVVAQTVRALITIASPGAVHDVDFGFVSTPVPSSTTSSSTSTSTTSTTVAPTTSSTTVAPTSTTTSSTTVAPTSTTTSTTAPAGTTTTAPAPTTTAPAPTTTAPAPTTTAPAPTTTAPAPTSTAPSGPTTTLAGCLSLGDRVWYDTNNNGSIDTGEAGVGSWPVRLIDSAGQLVTGMNTNADGDYLFSCIPAGDYRIEVPIPIGYQSSYPGGVDAAPSPTDNVVDNDDNGTGDGFVVRTALFSLRGNQPIGEPATPGFTDIVPDVQSNLTVDIGFTPGGSTTVATVALTTIAPTTVAPTSVSPTTAGPSTTGVPGATTTSPTTPSATLPPGNGNLCSEIFVDADQSGTRDPGEPALGGVQLQIDGPAGRRTAVTDRNGSYCSADLPPGDYTVTITGGVPAKYSYLTNQKQKVSVLGVQAERPMATFRVAPLALTGASTGRLFGAALSVLMAGLVMVYVSVRRRSASAPRA